MEQTTEVRALTVNEITSRWPRTLPLLAEYGIDTCCGGALRLDEVARRHALDLEALESRLQGAMSPTAA